MTWFIFAGDMIVMLFMVILIIWVFMVTPDREIDQAASIPLVDEEYESDLLTRPEDHAVPREAEEGMPNG